MWLIQYAILAMFIWLDESKHIKYVQCVLELKKKLILDLDNIVYHSLYFGSLIDKKIHWYKYIYLNL